MRLSDALAVKVGAANAVAVYAGGAKVWPAIEARALPTFVGIMGQYAPSNTATQNVTLPAGAVAGDVMVAVMATGAPGNPLVSPPDATVLINSQANGFVISQGFSQFVYAIKPADVAQGYVTVAVSASEYWVVDAAVFRNVDTAQMLDGTSVYLHQASTTATPMHMVVPGLATATDNAMLVFATFPGGSKAINGTTDGWGALPSGFAEAFRTGSGAHANSRYNMLYKAQAGKGATGDASQDFNWSDGSQYPNSFTGSLIALRGKPLTPAITLTINLPAPKVGVAYTGSITATNINGATGAIAITATPLPAGLSVGTVVANGDGSYTLPVTGTPTTAQSVDVGINATNGQQSATATQTLVVTAAAASPSIVQMASATTATGSAATTRTITLTNTPTPGNVLVAILGYYQVPSGASSSAPDGTWTVWTAGELRGINAFIHPIVSGDGKSYTFTLSTARNFGVVLYEVSSSNGVMNPVNTLSVSAGSTPTISVPADAGGSLALGMLKQGSQPAGGSSASGWTKDLYIAQSNGSLTMFHATSVAGTDTTLTAIGSTAGAALGLLLLAPKP